MPTMTHFVQFALRVTSVLPIVFLMLCTGHALLAQEIASIIYSSDTSLVLGGIVVDDETVVRDDLAGGITGLSVGMIPANTDLQALAAADGGSWLLSFDVATQLAGGVVAQPGDVVRFDGTSFSLEVQASSVGVPAGSIVDALAWLSSGALLLSFDTTVSLGGTVFEDEDLAEFSGGSFSMFFDGSANGVSPLLDLDAVAYDGPGERLFLSFDGSGQVPGGVLFDDEDVLTFRLSTGGWSLAYDGSMAHSSWPSADLDALEIELLGSVVFADGFETGDTSGWSSTVP